jgi:hypothetical protein
MLPPASPQSTTTRSWSPTGSGRRNTASDIVKMATDSAIPQVSTTAIAALASRSRISRRQPNQRSARASCSQRVSGMTTS